MEITLICEHCKKEFTVPYKQRNKKYCNRQCYIDAGIKGKTKQDDLYEKRICLNCGKEFEVRKKQQNKLCSDECRKKWSKKPENIKNRISLTRKAMNEKYGYSSIFESENGQKIVKESFKLKYGVDHPMKVDNILKKLKNTIAKKSKDSVIDRLNENKLELIDEYTKNKNGNTSKSYHFKCLKCGNIFSSTLLGSGKIPICRKCYPLIKNSKIEQSIKNLLNDYNINHTDNIKSIIKGKEIDLYIPEFSIGIEVNGNYYHSELYGNKDKNYHLEKTILCNENNIKLYHIFEDEIELKYPIVESILKNSLNLIDKKIFARKCIIKEVDKLTSSDFLNKNHLQGNCVDKIRYGLYYENELVSIMTFGNLRNSLGYKNKNKNEFELLRFCNKINYSVSGGFSKLLKYFVRNNNFSKIITYADIRWSGINPERTVYFKNGFNFIKNTPPNYWYVNFENSLYKFKRYHRYQFRKNILIENGYDKNKTEWEIMKERKFDRIWDCGNMKFEYIKKEE